MDIFEDEQNSSSGVLSYASIYHVLESKDHGEEAQAGKAYADLKENLQTLCYLVW